jgi:curli biogenesis system outer membrane secretion channel CsgG
MRRYSVVLAAIIFLLWGCAVTGPLDRTSATASSEGECVSFPPYSGSKHTVEVVDIQIPREVIDRYPELREKRVGHGLGAILLQTISDTGRFTLLEDSGQILGRIIEQWELTDAGIFVRVNRTRTALELLAADFLMYAKVFDFVACSPADIIGPLGKHLTCLTSVGVQVRMVNSATRELVVGSTNLLSQEGSYAHTKDLPIFGDARLAFDQAAVGKATQKSTRCAVRKALQRADEIDFWKRG